MQKSRKLFRRNSTSVAVPMRHDSCLIFRIHSLRVSILSPSFRRWKYPKLQSTHQLFDEIPRMEATQPSLSHPKFQPNLSPLPPRHPTDHRRPLVSVTRRLALSSSLSSLVFLSEPARAFDFGFVKPGQTVEDAVGAVRGHARSLLAVKPLLESESWEEAQREMRERSALLKQDVYTIIQSRPGGERPRLRKLYSDLFNGVSKLDYAARERDGPRVWRCYEKMSAALEEILSLI